MTKSFEEIAGRILSSGTDTVDIVRQIVTALKVERERCGKIADIWANTKPVSGSAAPLIATVTSDTGKAIATAIRDGTEPKKTVPEITIHLSGGVISSVSSNGPAKVFVYDFNNIEDEDDCEATVHSFGEGGKVL